MYYVITDFGKKYELYQIVKEKKTYMFQLKNNNYEILKYVSKNLEIL